MSLNILLGVDVLLVKNGSVFTRDIEVSPTPKIVAVTVLPRSSAKFICFDC